MISYNSVNSVSNFEFNLSLLRIKMRFFSLVTLFIQFLMLTFSIQGSEIRGRRFAPNSCRLAIARGICYGHHVRYGYYKEGRRCVQFDYSGCDGNQNNFMTMDECIRTCQ